MKLNLRRPLAFFDLETTGINISADRIVEISILKALPNGDEEVKTWKVNPGIPIPLESSLIHGIYDKDIEGAPTFKEIGAEVAAFLEDADLAGYNSNKFDIPLIMEEFLRNNISFDLEGRSFVDVQNIFHQMEQRTLKAAYKFYCDSSLENAHSAEADVRATYEVLKAQIERYEGQSWENKKGEVSTPVQNDVQALHEFTNLTRPVDFAGRLVFDENGVEVFSFGKHKGKAVEDVFGIEPSYYSWMMQGDFPLYTKRCLEKIWARWRANMQSSPSQQTSSAPLGKIVPKTKVTAASDKHQQQQKKTTQGYSKNKKGQPITADMLVNLQEKFKK
ncbi:3'-5' exonuclease [Olivibacter sitiensis]|uniref:3'-5' exonuclease n=1 Tax=Olivibacter sitiensis TaxID=376470 RepID=UPI00047FC0F9|nr:3'-5' exonuclease [Olivibacter sitiensis]